MTFENGHVWNGGHEEESALHARNRMQIALADRFYGFVSDEKRIEWITEYADVFSRLLKSDEGKNILQHFQENPEEALSEAEQFLYAEKHA